MGRRQRINRWIPISEAAALVGENPRRMRRRLHALNARHGGCLLRNFGVGLIRPRLEVSAEALVHLLRADFPRDDLDDVRQRVGLLEERLEVLRDAHRQTRRDLTGIARRSPAVGPIK